MKIIILMFLTFSLSFCNINSKEIAKALKYNALKYNIDKKILYTIAKIESNFNTNVIAFVSDKKVNIIGKNIKIKNLNYKNKYLIQISSDINTLKKIAIFFIQKGYKIDVGLMQINSQNFTLQELDYIFNLDYNISKAVDILYQCKNKFKNVKNTIECYNKGNKLGKNYDYYKRFLSHYVKDFG
ncbi:lytic transglycosylase domain-containing protein [Campylobacter jejuni]|nr:lytic transglycosylase domain-containing protein [Campylobacter jejuni]ECP8663271.1 lytic transglycosylase domain-containing protein [Campylobacter jejuni]ECP9001625.1 lytic transglycosylase domain-containing protein [Campylobacter jejuni]ECQ8738081.1 lytic transglycosylase domain-containing protein [Campylobacter jejuni]EDP0209138.1 lytic transglycosylase domain-containing protein [Campylobacter jejuni]